MCSGVGFVLIVNLLLTSVQLVLGLFFVASNPFGFRKSEPKWSKEKMNRIKDMLKDGKTGTDIAKEFEVPVQTLYAAMNRAGLSVKDYRVTVKNMFKDDKNEDDLSSRVRFLKGESVDKPEAKAFFYDWQLKRWLGWFSDIELINLKSKFSVAEINEFITNEALGVYLFCKEVLGVELQHYQIKMVSMMRKNKRNIFNLGRQVGKDFTISCYSLWLCVTCSNRKIVIVSPAQRQSDLLFNRIKAWIGNSDELFASIKSSTMEIMEFKNGSKMYALPATSYIRGFTEVTDAFMNEVAHGIGEDSFAAVEPMLSRLNGGLHLFSSPAGCEGMFWNCWNNPAYKSMHLTSFDNKYLSRDYLEQAKKTLSSQRYDNEINAEFLESISNFFPRELIERCIQEYDPILSPTSPDQVYFMGIDWGRIRDQTVIIVVSKQVTGEVRVERLKELDKVPFAIQLQEIIKFQRIYKCKRIMAEYAGLSLPLCERLRLENLPVIFFKPTLDRKEEAFDYLLVQMERGLITIPRHDKLIYELGTFRYELVGATGKKKLHHMMGSSDDIVDGLCLATWASRISEASFGLAGVRQH